MRLASERIYRHIYIIIQEQHKTETVCGGMGMYAKSDIGGIGRLLDEDPEDLPRTNEKAVIPPVVLAEFTNRMKRHSPPPATGNVPVNLEPLSCLLFSSRATSRQFSPSADVSTSHDFR
jgi:hypothetical protein